MSSAGASALQKAVFAALSGDSALSDLLGGPKIFDHVPPKTPFPYVTLGQTAVYDWSTSSEKGQEHFFTIHVWARTQGRKLLLDLMERVASVLEDQMPALSGHCLVNLMLNDMQARNDDGVNAYQGVMRYRAVTEPAV